MLYLRKFDFSDNELVSSRFNIPLAEANLMIEKWNSGLFNVSFFVMFAVQNDDIGSISNDFSIEKEFVKQKIRDPLDKLYRMRYNYVGGADGMSNKYESLRLKNQICFPLYAVSNMITRKYKPFLDELDLTYTQYIVMMVLWEHGQANEKLLCEALCLKSNTVTPLLKKLQDKGYIEKTKDKGDERNLVITLTETGKKLQDKALRVPECMAKEFHLTPDEATALYGILYNLIDEEKNKNRG